MESAWALFRETWTYPLTVIDGQAITVGTVVVAVILLFVGHRVSRQLSRAIGGVLVRRFRIETGPAAAIQTLAFYVLFVAFGVTALRVVHFPLTAFTILGGALAIGLGFGSQNIMNNFISGLILMLERPIRPGDLVQVEGTHGVVEEIGARSTRILASNNTHIIVPNSFFLENNVVNFTLSDDVLRTQVNVGVVYGSPTREAARLIRQALDENEGVLRSPAPEILFTEFGDNALLFEALFWVRARRILQRRRIESEVRFRIDDLFRAAGIVIAFPQRDVHVDSVKPIEVRVVSGGSQER
ncbi:MAG: hypothetical protein A2W29_11095 [Gemmatimonadetes bacterium RBG_16_66_8]|nr:MAG: hypothetical protein A2W29_11095 [Gemmatimonadetes bacterium RBG_16_66_8]